MQCKDLFLYMSHEDVYYLTSLSHFSFLFILLACGRLSYHRCIDQIGLLCT